MPGCSTESSEAATHPADEAPLNVVVTVCNMAGNVLLSDTSVSTRQDASAGEFAQLILDYMMPAPEACDYIFSSSCFNGVLTKQRVDHRTGLTQSNDEPLAGICSEPLYDGKCLMMQATLVASELHRTRCEEEQAYQEIMEQTSHDRVYHMMAETSSSYDEAMAKWESRHHDLSRVRHEELEAYRSFMLWTRHDRVHSCTDSTFATYDEAKLWWTSEQNDLNRVLSDASENFYKEMSRAEYVCPFAAGVQHCNHTFKSREALSEHLQVEHSHQRLVLPSLKFAKPRFYTYQRVCQPLLGGDKTRC